MAALDAKIQSLELGSSAMAALRLAICTSTVFKTALLARSVITPRAKNIGCGVANVGLAESSHEAFGSIGVIGHGTLQEPRSNALVVSRSMSVVSKHGSAVNGEPRQNTNVLAIRSTLEAEESHGNVSFCVVLSTLLIRVVKIGPE